MTLDATAFAILLTMNIAWNNPVPDGDLMCMSHALYHESAIDTEIGKIAVAHTVLTRVKERNFPNTVCGVVTSRGAFSYLNNGERSHLTINNDFDYRKFEQIVELSLKVMTGKIPDPTNGANHYLNKDIVTRIPNWYTEGEKRGKFGKYHSFAYVTW